MDVILFVGYAAFILFALFGFFVAIGVLVSDKEDFPQLSPLQHRLAQACGSVYVFLLIALIVHFLLSIQ